MAQEEDDGRNQQPTLATVLTAWDFANRRIILAECRRLLDNAGVLPSPGDGPLRTEWTLAAHALREKITRGWSEKDGQVRIRQIQALRDIYQCWTNESGPQARPPPHEESLRLILGQ